MRRRFVPSVTVVMFAASVLGALVLARCGASRESPSASPKPASASEPAAGSDPLAALGQQPGESPVPAASAAPASEPAGSPPPSAAPPAAPAKAAYVVAAIGDSLTDARAHGGKFLDYLKQRCPESEFVNYGKGGDMVNQMRRRFDPQVLGSGKSFTHLIVWGGVNDLYSDLTAGRTPHKVARDLSYMYAAAHERGMKVVAITVAPWGGFKQYYNARRGGTTLELNRWIEKQAEEGAVDAVIDAYSLLSCGDPQRLCKDYEISFRDGLHIGPKGHEVIGKALYEKVFSNCL